MRRPTAPPDKSFFRASRTPDGESAVSVGFGTVRISIAGLGEDNARLLVERNAPFSSARPSAAGGLSLNVGLEDFEYFIQPPERPERNPILIACDGTVIRYLGYRLAAMFDLESSEGTVLLSRGEYEPLTHAFDNLLMACTAWLAATGGGAMVHGTGVVRRGKGYLLFGPSGAGKSTAAKHSGNAKVIGDDVSVVLPGEDGKLNLVGNPFRGAFREAEPVVGSFPLEACFRLVKAERSEIVDASRLAVYAALVGNFPFVADSFNRRPDLMDRMEGSFRDVPMRNLHFARDATFWDEIDRFTAPSPSVTPPEDR